jgi:PhnB protein
MSEGTAFFPTRSQLPYARPGLAAITPYLLAERAAELIAFLKDAFGGTERVGASASDGTEIHTVAIGNGAVEVSEASAANPPAPCAIHLYVEDADAVYARALQAGAASIYEVADQAWGDRQGAVKDAWGNHWYVAKANWNPGPEGVSTVQPFLHLRDAGEIIPFLVAAFEAEDLGTAQSGDGVVLHGTIRIGNATLEIDEAHDAFQPMPCWLHVYVPDADRAYAQAIGAGATPMEAPQGTHDGERSAAVKDAWGVRWLIATRVT